MPIQPSSRKSMASRIMSTGNGIIIETRTVAKTAPPR